MVLSSQTIKELRDKSGAGMLDCKKALEESEGNVEKAIEWLRKKGINTANKKAIILEASKNLYEVAYKPASWGPTINSNIKTSNL